jgi:hypothetical protein
MADLVNTYMQKAHGDKKVKFLPLPKTKKSLKMIWDDRSDQTTLLLQTGPVEQEYVLPGPPESAAKFLLTRRANLMALYPRCRRMEKRMLIMVREHHLFSSLLSAATDGGLFTRIDTGGDLTPVSLEPERTTKNALMAYRSDVMTSACILQEIMTIDKLLEQEPLMARDRNNEQFEVVPTEDDADDYIDPFAPPPPPTVAAFVPPLPGQADSSSNNGTPTPMEVGNEPPVFVQQPSQLLHPSTISVHPNGVNSQTGAVPPRAIVAPQPPVAARPPSATFVTPPTSPAPSTSRHSELFAAPPRALAQATPMEFSDAVQMPPPTAPPATLTDALDEFEAELNNNNEFPDLRS